VGALRGLGKFTIDFGYPISAIAGKNGSGKSTILALAACAFHNDVDGWKLPDRKISYYTFSDFFIQTSEDVPVGGVSIHYRIHHNSWRPTNNRPDGIGVGLQIRKKKKGGKWNDYDERVERCVAFLGIERVVPPAERSVYKSYRYSFSSSARAGWEERVRDSVSKVLGVSYEDFEIKSYGKYRLPLVKKKGSHYSGFNMGAGEKALFEVFAAIFAAPDGSLFLIDELELGLHEAAQKRLVRELSEICNKKKVQIICTTHSSAILGALPPEGRFLIQNGKFTQILTGVSPAYASGRLREMNSGELVIFVEDSVAATLLESALDHSTLQRVSVVPIGSHSAVVHQVAARFLEGTGDTCVAVLDGDQVAAYEAHCKKFFGYIGGAAKGAGLDAWVTSRILIFPDGIAPETWVFKNLSELEDSMLEEGFNVPDSVSIREAIDNALLSSDHAQVYAFSQSLGKNAKYVWRDCCQVLMRYSEGSLESLRESIRDLLN
jgi:predicted ATPase